MTATQATEKQFGFVCPDWAVPHWNQNECTVEKCTDGTHIVLDHSLNGVVIYAAETEKECREWLG